MNSQGQIEFMSTQAKTLLALVCHPTITTETHTEIELLAKLAQLCRNLNTIFHGKHADPPSWSYTNGRGRFIFRAYWLNRESTEPSGFIGMTIEHQEPLTLKLLRAMQKLPLPPMQKQVALMVAQGFSNEKISEQMHIKLSTVKDHLSKIFTTLDINHREELLPKLLALEKSQAIYLPLSER